MKLAVSISAKLLSVACAAALLGSTAAAEAAAKPSTTKKTASHSTASKGKKSKKSASWRRRGQQKIDKQRATEIQRALVREHYLDGEPSGVWDQKTQSALQRYQADNGWQSKTTPDSRALIKLGLGPDHQHLLNPESAMTTAPVVTQSGEGKSAVSGTSATTPEETPKVPN